MEVRMLLVKSIAVKLKFCDIFGISVKMLLATSKNWRLPRLDNIVGSICEMVFCDKTKIRSTVSVANTSTDS